MCKSGKLRPGDNADNDPTATDMTTIDFLILAIVAASMVIGYFRGFFPEVVGVATWVVAGLGAIHFGGVIEPYLTGKMGSATVEMWTSRAAMFVLLMIGGGLIGQLVSLVVDKAGLSGTDKTLGLVFGAIRGVLILGVLVIFAQLIGFPKDAGWTESRLVPFGESIAEGIRTLLPERVAEFVTPKDDPAPDTTDAGMAERALDVLQSLGDNPDIDAETDAGDAP